MASSYGVIKNNVQNFLKNTNNYGYRVIDNPVEFMEKNFHAVPGRFYELITYGTIRKLVHNGEIILGLCIDSKYKDVETLGVFTFSIYDEKIYCSDKMGAKEFNTSMKKFNSLFKAYCGFSADATQEHFTQCFGCVNDNDLDIKERIVDSICNEVTDILNDVYHSRVEYIKAKRDTTDTHIHVRSIIRQSEEQREVNELEAMLERAKMRLEAKKREVSAQENLELLASISKVKQREHEQIVNLFKKTVLHHVSLKPIPRPMAMNIENAFTRMLEKTKQKSLDECNEKD